MGWRDISAANGQACGALANGELECWGSVSGTLPGEAFRQVVTGDAFACALAAAPAMVFPLASDGEVEALERDWWRDVVRSTFRGAGVEPSAGDFDACFDALFEAFARPSAWSSSRCDCYR